MDQTMLEIDLEETLEFQCAFVEVACAGLDVTFVDNNFISCFKILNSINMSLRHIKLLNWNVTNL